MIDFMPLSGGQQGEALILLLLALAVDVGVGLVPVLGRLLPDRLGTFTVLVRFLDSRLNRSGRSEVSLLIRGFVVAVFLVLVAVVAGLFVAWLGQTYSWGWWVQLALLVVCLSSRRVMADMRRGSRILGTDDLAEGQELVSRAVGRDASRLDRHGVARIVIEIGAVGFARRTVVPAFWFALLGFPGLFVWRVLSRIVSITAHRDAPSARAFGAAAIKLDHVIGLLPSLVAGWLLAIAALVVPQARIGAALGTMSRDAARDEIVNDGRLKGAAAGALGLALGGPFGNKGGGGIRDAWIGNGRARVGQSDIRRMLYLVAVASLMWLGMVAALTAVRL